MRPLLARFLMPCSMRRKTFLAVSRVSVCILMISSFKLISLHGVIVWSQKSCELFPASTGCGLSILLVRVSSVRGSLSLAGDSMRRIKRDIRHATSFKGQIRTREGPLFPFVFVRRDRRDLVAFCAALLRWAKTVSYDRTLLSGIVVNEALWWICMSSLLPKKNKRKNSTGAEASGVPSFFIRRSYRMPLRLQARSRDRIERWIFSCTLCSME